MNKKRLIVPALLVLGVLFIFVGGTYAFFMYNKEGNSHEIIAGDIYLNIDRGSNLNLNNIYPETRTEARSRNDNYITFEIDGKNDSDETIYYEINLSHDEDVSGKTRFNDSDLMFDLYETNDGVDTLLIGSVNFDELNNAPIWTDKITKQGHYNYDIEYDGKYYAADTSSEGIAKCQTIAQGIAGSMGDMSDDQDNYYNFCALAGTVFGISLPIGVNKGWESSISPLEEAGFLSEVTPEWIDEDTTFHKTYKLRMWLSDKVIVSDTESDATYRTSDYANHYANVKVKVVGDFNEKEKPYAYLAEGDIVYQKIYSINNDGVNKITFTKLSSNELNSRYNSASSKVDLTEKETSNNKVYAFREDDELVVASDKLIVLNPFSVYMLSFPNVNEINFSNINTSIVSTMEEFFLGAGNESSILEINGISDWDVISLRDCLEMFRNTNGAIFDLSGWDTSNLVHTRSMFRSCPNLTTVYVGEYWTVENVFDSNDMFSSSHNIVGGNGKTWDSNYIDKTFAIADSPSTPGYLTMKTYKPKTTKYVYAYGDPDSELVTSFNDYVSSGLIDNHMFIRQEFYSEKEEVCIYMNDELYCFNAKYDEKEHLYEVFGSSNCEDVIEDVSYSCENDMFKCRYGVDFGDTISCHSKVSDEFCYTWGYDGYCGGLNY